MLHTILLSVHFSFILHLSIYLCNSIRHFQISSSHINSPTVDISNLSFCNQFLCNLFIIISNETKSSTRFRYRVSYNLALFNFSILRKMVFEIIISQLIIKTTNKHFVTNRFIMFSSQFVQFSFVPSWIKLILSMFYLGADSIINSLL